MRVLSQALRARAETLPECRSCNSTLHLSASTCSRRPAQFCISRIRGSMAYCRTSRRYCPDPCRLSKCQHPMFTHVAVGSHVPRHRDRCATVARRSLMLGCWPRCAGLLRAGCHRWHQLAAGLQLPEECSETFRHRFSDGGIFSRKHSSDCQQPRLSGQHVRTCGPVAHRPFPSRITGAARRKPITTD
jgi:hypothetical protein